MRKVLFSIAVIAALGVGGTSFAVYRAGGDEGSVPRPVSDLQVQKAAAPTRGGCGGSCCGGGPAAGATARAAQIESYLIDFYTKSIGPTITVKVQDFGCHHEADILQNGEFVKRLSINGGTISDITGA